MSSSPVPQTSLSPSDCPSCIRHMKATPTMEQKVLQTGHKHGLQASRLYLNKHLSKFHKRNRHDEMCP